jgi:hypothetical protein
MHAILVPDQGKTWIVSAANLDLAVSRARAILPNAPDAPTLAKRTDLAPLRDAHVASAGFVTARALVGSSPMSHLLGMTKSHAGVSSSQGTAPIFFLTRSEARPQGGAFILTSKISRESMQDVIKAAMSWR